MFSNQIMVLFFVDKKWCLIQGKIIVCFPWIERFFMNYAIFLDIFKLSHVASTKVTRVSLRMET